LPEKIMTYLNLADAHIANNDPASARKSIREALHHASGHAQLCSMLANILENLPCSGSAAESPGTQGNNI
ncbi:MAG: hypothetical protein L6290_07785, partial [Thermodesulfovibrionales bacterium]|nr:hypothetical protein [Thermodesulfovibrionales bacterium]